MAFAALPAELRDAFGGVLTFNPRSDGRVLVSYRSPYCDSTQADLDPAALFDALNDTTPRDLLAPARVTENYARAPVGAQYKCLPLPRALAIGFDYYFVGGPDLFAESVRVQTPPSPTRGRGYVPPPPPAPDPAWVIIEAARLHSDGFEAYIRSRGGLVESRDSLYYADTYAGIPAHLAAAARKRAKFDRVVIGVTGAVVSLAVGPIIGALTSAAGSAVEAETPPNLDSIDTLSELGANADLSVFGDATLSFADSVAGDTASELMRSITGSSSFAELTAGTSESGVLGSVGSLASGAGSLLRSVTNALIGGVTSSAGSAGNQLVAILQTLAAGLHDIVSATQQTLLPVLTPIRDAVAVVGGAMRDLNDNLIRPVFGTLADLTRIMEATQKAIERDLGNGLDGLVRASQTLSDAFAGMESTLNRSIDRLSAAQLEAINTAWRQQLGEQVGAPLTQVSDSLRTRYQGGGVSEEMAQLYHFGTDTDAQKIAESLRKVVYELRNAEGLWSPFLHLIATLLDAGPMLLGYLKASGDDAYIAGRSIFQNTQLSVGDLLNAAQRRIIDDATLRGELNKEGYNDIRQKVLVAINKRAWTIPEAIDQWRRGMIGEATMRDLLTRAGVEDDDLDRTIRLSEGMRPLNVLLQEYSLLAAARSTNALGSEELTAPDDFVALAGETGASIGLIHATWRLQWALPSVQAATQLYFRRLITLDELHGFYNIANVPRPLWDKILEAQRTIIPARTAVSMRKAGIIDSSTMHEYVMQNGYSLVDAERFIALAEKEDAPTSPQVADELHGLTQSTIINLYDAGSIEVSVAVDLLVEIGIGREAATLAVELADIKRQTVERKAAADLIIAQVKAGALNIEQAQGELLAVGLTTTETERVYTALLNAQRDRNKLPSLSDLGDFWKKGLIDDAAYVYNVGLLGYARTWAELYLQALKLKPTPTP